MGWHCLCSQDMFQAAIIKPSCLKMAMRQMIWAAAMIYAASAGYIYAEDYIYKDKLLFFSPDGKESTLISRDHLHGFTTHEKTYREGWVNGRYRRWAERNALIGLSTASSLSISPKYFPSIKDFFLMANEQRYASHKNVSLEYLANLLWVWTHFHLDPGTPTSEASPARPAKINCFLENLLLLIRSSPSIQDPLHGILFEISKNHGTCKSEPPKTMVPRDRLFWFLSCPQNAHIKRFLSTLLGPRTSNISIYAQKTGDEANNNALRIIVTPSHIPNRTDAVPLSSFFLEQTTHKYTHLLLDLHEAAVLSPDVFAHLFIIFSGVHTLTLSTNRATEQSVIDAASILIRDILFLEEQRRRKNLPVRLRGLILSHAILLTQESTDLLQKTPLETFGFMQFYPADYTAEQEYHKKHIIIEGFITELFINHTVLSSYIKKLVGPDALFFANRHIEGLRNLVSIEIHTDGRMKHGVIQPLDIKDSRIQKVAIVEEAGSTEKDTYRILAGLASIKHMRTLDLKRTTVQAKKLLYLLLDKKVQYKRTLRIIEIPYMEGTSNDTSLPLHLLTTSLKGVRAYGVYVRKGTNPLKRLIQDVQKTFLSRRISIWMHLQSISWSPEISTYSLHPYTISRPLFKEAYQAAGAQARGSFGEEELFRMLSIGTALNKQK
ncbi:hypothetical protein NERG_00299 [Nematocida ausubeli]|uniref:Uncharacterized protein n=1 Tax=Nematocida ausubeli (strain ATCC PRA-371 / ERTm2) TaxID=1913371 RepID=H8Z9M8_NEMA1|nr:hypothetical protein NERG_00299 [Nematocida ausubeli]